MFKMENIKAFIWFSLVYLSSSMASFGEMSEDYRDIFYSAITNITYVPSKQSNTWKSDSCSRFATNSRIESQFGWVVYINTKENQECVFPSNYVFRKESKQWIAFIERDFCNINTNSSFIKNASAVVFYDSGQRSHAALHIQAGFYSFYFVM